MAQKIPQITGDGAPATWGELKKKNIAWGEFTWGEPLQNSTNPISASQSKPEAQKQ